MKKMMLLVSLILALALAMPAFAGASNGNGKNTSSHQIIGVLEGTDIFVPFPDSQSTMSVDSLSHGSGIVRSLGSTHIFTFHRPLPDGTGVSDGLVKIVAANHDTLQGHYGGGTLFQEPEPPYQIIGNVDFVITGGTGRFANASGTIHATVYVTFLGFDVFEWPVTWVLEGTVEY